MDIERLQAARAYARDNVARLSQKLASLQKMGGPGLAESPIFRVVRADLRAAKTDLTEIDRKFYFLDKNRKLLSSIIDTVGEVVDSLETTEKLASDAGDEVRTGGTRKRLASILYRLAKIVEADDMASDVAHKSLKEVEGEMAHVYPNQSQNTTYYFRRRGILPPEDLGGAKNAPAPPKPEHTHTLDHGPAARHGPPGPHA